MPEARWTFGAATLATLLAMIVAGAMWLGAQAAELRGVRSDLLQVHAEYGEVLREMKELRKDFQDFKEAQAALHAR